LYICIYENKTVKPVKIVPRRKRRGWGRTIEWI
jgi:hypothetical protein